MSDSLRPGQIRLRGISRKYRVLHDRNQTLKETLIRGRRTLSEDIWVLRDVDLDIAPGESVGVIGRNGIGKSTLLKLVSGIIPPQAGTIDVGGVVAPLLELGAGFHIDFTGRENVEMQGALYGLTRREVAERFDDIVEFSEIRSYIDMPVRTYSSGMFMRLAFSVAAHVNADVLLLDEVLAVGDVAFQRKCIRRIQDLRAGGCTLLFVSHSKDAVEQVCDRCILLDYGSIVCDGTTADAFAAYAESLRVAGHEATVAVGDERDRGGANWGSGTVRIDSVRLRRGNEVSDTFAPGEPMAIELLLEPNEAVPFPVVVVNLSGGDGRPIGSTRATAADLGLDELTEPTWVTLAFRRLPLQQGRFHVSVLVESPDRRELYHHREACCSFSVFSDDVGAGPVAMGGHWSATAASAER